MLPLESREGECAGPGEFPPCLRRSFWPQRRMVLSPASVILWDSESGGCTDVILRCSENALFSFQNRACLSSYALEGSNEEFRASVIPVSSGSFLSV